MRFDDLGITTSDQLRQLAQRLGLPKIKYIGFAEDIQTLENGYYIINLGDSVLSGTHWTMMYVDPSRIVYFDSYGVGPENRIINLARESGREIFFTSKQVQRYEEYHCGVWVILAMKAIHDAVKKNKDPVEAIDGFVSKYDAV